jgi:hypothetical protein
MISRPVLGLACGLLLSTASISFGQDASASLNEDGSVAISGIVQPGREVSIPANCAAKASEPEVVACVAESFLATLSEEQQSEVLLALSEENSTSWSNLPCGANCRVGIQLADLDADQQAAALAVIKAATSDYGDDGFDEFTQIMMADDVLGASQASSEGGSPGAPPADGSASPDGMGEPPADGMGGPPGGGISGGGGYSAGSYFIAFLGTPGATETWQLQFGGHHLALLKTYTGNEQVGATPAFVGVEPKVWTDGGRIYAPLEDDRDAMAAMLAGLSETQLAAAKLDEAYSDVLLGPGADGEFPGTKVGLGVSELDDAQKVLVLAAMGEWVRDTAAGTADAIMADYEAGLNETYIAFSGNSSLSNHADYVRIDGPRVWIEFVCQNGVVYGTEIHYHTIWRDHETDYGAVYSF